MDFRVLFGENVQITEQFLFYGVEIVYFMDLLKVSDLFLHE